MIHTDFGIATIGLRPPMAFDPRGDVAVVLILGTNFSNQANLCSRHKAISLLPSISITNTAVDLRIYREKTKALIMVRTNLQPPFVSVEFFLNLFVNPTKMKNEHLTRKRFSFVFSTLFCCALSTELSKATLIC